MDEHLSAGQAFGRYQIVRPIGEGGMGIVYEASHPGLKKRFAIKTLHPTYASNEEARLRFLREAEAASSISHPNVVAVTDVGLEGQMPYMVMELLEGETLDRLFATRGPLSVEESVELLLPVISAAAAGHQRGIIHRDLKPQNIFLSRGHRGEIVPKILDFGVSKLMRDENPLLTKTMAVLGTAAYMSPEQAQGAKRVDFQSDQYALGLILFECLTGRRAYPGESALEILHKAANGAVVPARQLRPDLPPALDAVLTRMLAVPIRNRYSSLHEVGRALLVFASPRSRLNFAEEFAAGAAAPGDPAVRGLDVVSAALSSGAERLNSTSSGPSSTSGLDVRSGGTRVLATADDPPVTETTLRHVAAEVSAARAAGSARGRGRSSLGIAAAVALVLAGAGALVATRRSGRTGRRETAQTSGEKAESAAAATGTSGRQEAKADTETPASTTRQPTEAPLAEAPISLFEIRATPPEAEIILDGKPPVRGHISLVLPLGGTAHLLRVSAPGFVSKVVPFAATERPPAEIRLTPIVGEKAAGEKVAVREKTAGAKKTASLASPSSSVSSSSASSSSGNVRANLPTSPARETSRSNRAVRSSPSPSPSPSLRVADAPKGGDAPRPTETAPQPRRGANNALMIPLN